MAIRLMPRISDGQFLYALQLFIHPSNKQYTTQHQLLKIASFETFYRIRAGKEALTPLVDT
jgi:hypothetical protein